jgi:hypothetical protein
VTARKIRMTAVGLVAMPVAYDEAKVTADDLANDAALCAAFAELLAPSQEASENARASADRCGTYEERELAMAAVESIESAWEEAQDAAADNDIAKLRAGIRRARATEQGAGLDTMHEDAALAMLPPAEGRAA